MSVFDEVSAFSYKNNISLFGLTNEFFAIVINNFFNCVDDGLLIVTPSMFEARKIYDAINRYNDNCFLFENDSLSFINAFAASPILKTERLSILNELLNNNKRIVVTDLVGYLRHLPPVSDYTNKIIKLSVGDNISIENIISQLDDLGYKKENLVVKMGDFAVRGYILDIFLIGSDNPIRIEFFGDDIESIRFFNSDDQRSISSVDFIEIYPNDEISTSEYVNISSYLGNCYTVIKDYNQICVSYKNMVQEFFDYNRGESLFFELDEISLDKVIYYNDFDNYKQNNNFIDFGVSNLDYNGNGIGYFNDYVKKCLLLKKTIIICLSNINNIDDLFDFSYVFTDINNIFDGRVNIVTFPLGEGFSINNYIFLSEKELFNRSLIKKKDVKFKYSKRINDITKINIGDYVVHQACGIGIYNGIKTITKNGVLNDYIEILYANGDKLFIPVSKIDLISKFSGKEGYVPKINSLNSNVWEKTKRRVSNKIKYEAERLLRVQAERKLKKGFAFSKDNELQTMFDNEFLYEATDDQIRATMEIKKDMESNIPMDRLLCGDVGYGKTEVAFRAMFKAVLDNKQVMYLCPTTLLSRQQYLSALDRFKNFPVRIELLNRFVSPKNVKRIIDDFNEGNVDILFGTHRILSNDIKPKDLGLLVIDEEQRFGVAHKEKIKEYKSNIDVLTLTATPIPRTLQMAIFGLKDLSLIETPPKDRHAVQTYVLAFDKNIIRDIIYRELSRDGQVFILYNRVDDIELKVREIQMIVPEARIAFAHGKMNKDDLENIMNDFVLYKYDVLICTTIIETGVDIPNVNTLIVYNSDWFGLSQLYQIRGRVGRSDRIAYAYLTYEKNKVLTENSIKRLQVLKDFTELGSGFTIAARDLSIRGSGDILGSEQAGYIDCVGIDLYMKMLNDEILKLKGIEVSNENEDVISNLEINNHISDFYTTSDELKIEFHKLINSIDSYEKYDLVYNELTDRFGRLNDEIILYMNKELFENYSKKIGISRIVEDGFSISVMFDIIRSNTIDYEDLITKSLKISNRFVFSYKHNCLFIKILKNSGEDNPILLFNKLFKEI